MEIVAVRPLEARPYLRHYLHWLEGVERDTRGEFTVEQILHDIERCELYLWLALDGAVVIAACGVSLVDIPGGDRVCRIRFCTGRDMRRWVGRGLEMIEGWARDNGATCMRGWMRPGWQRVLKGYRMTHVMLERDLTDGQ